MAAFDREDGTMSVTHEHGYVQLYKALGGGWNLTDPQAPPTTAEVRQPAGCAGNTC